MGRLLSLLDGSDEYDVGRREKKLKEKRSRMSFDPLSRRIFMLWIPNRNRHHLPEQLEVESN